MIPRVILISRKASAESINGAGESVGGLSPSEQSFSPLRKLLGSREHLHWLKIDLMQSK